LLAAAGGGWHLGDAGDPERAGGVVGTATGKEYTVRFGDAGDSERIGGVVGAEGAGSGSIVLLPTSGSTGTPKLVQRSEDSLVSEGERYRLAVALAPHDRVLIPLPLSHAYALGWLYGALAAGCEVVPVTPTALNRIGLLLAEGCTVLVLSPALARLLAERRTRQAADKRPAVPALRLAMVGAGPVDSRLDDLFRAAFGIGTARNYGSTETGAVFCGPEGLPPGCVGAPMPGVRHRLVDDTGADIQDGPGVLEVRADDADPWHSMGDLAVAEPAGLRILGRRHSAIRRGGRWVSPLEIEDVLRTHPEVLDAHVTARAQAREGEDRIVARVMAAPGLFDPAALRAHCQEQLAAYKVPDEIRLVERIERTQTGKARGPRRYRLAAQAPAAARAYKAAELLFALDDLGVLDDLDGDTDTEELALRLDCDPDALARLLAAAALLGLVSDAADLAAQSAGPDGALDFIRLEARLSRSWVTREELAAVARTGIRNRRFDRAADHGALAEVYQKAMSGDAARARARLAVRLLRPSPGARLLEVAAGPGVYWEALLSRDPTATGALVRLGRLAGDCSPAVAEAVADGRVLLDPPLDPESLPRRAFDICVVTNGIHGPGSGSRLDWLLGALRPGGRIVVDDVFAPSEPGAGTELLLDWLTHGGSAFPHVSDLIDALRSLGARVDRHLPLDSSVCHLILATESQ